MGNTTTAGGIFTIMGNMLFANPWQVAAGLPQNIIIIQSFTQTDISNAAAIKIYA